MDALSNCFRPILVFTARCYAERGYTLVGPMSTVCLSVTLRYRDHIGWNTSKIISRPNSLRPLLGLTTTRAIWCNGNTPKIMVEWRWGHSGAQKTCNISETVQDRTKLTMTDYRKSHTRFRLVPKSVTLDDLERRIHELPKVLKYLLLSQERVKLWTSNLAGTFTSPSEQKPIKILEKWERGHFITLHYITLQRVV